VYGTADAAAEPVRICAALPDDEKEDEEDAAVAGSRTGSPSPSLRDRSRLSLSEISAVEGRH
jgi:hypothetical protein